MLVLGAVACLAATAYLDDTPHRAPIAEDNALELLLVDVYYQRFRLEPEMSALQDSRGRMFVPLRQLGEALGFRIHVEPDRGVAMGFLGDPKDRITLNGTIGKCVRNRRTTSFDSSAWFPRDHDLYLDSDFVSNSMGVHFKWKPNQLEVEVSSDRPLRLRQLWLMRNILDAKAPPATSGPLPKVGLPFSFCSIPSVDLSLYTDTAVGDKATIQSASRMQVDGSGDLAFLSAHYRYISSGPGQPTSALVSLGREDPEAKLLGPFRATQFSLGDLNLPQVSLLSRPENGLGATISNYPLSSSVTKANEIEGSAPARSIIEAYRGSVLLDMVRADDKGRYTFDPLPLESGPNDLTIVVLTPDGDVNEVSRTVFGTTSGPSAGEGRYRLTEARVGDSILPHSLASFSTGPSHTETVGEYELGLSPSSWVSATGAVSDGQEFTGLGVNSWVGRSLMRFQSMVSASGGAAVSGGITQRWGRTVISLDHTLAQRSVGSELAPEYSANTTQITKLEIDGSTESRTMPIGYDLNIDRENGSDPATFIRGLMDVRQGGTIYSNMLAARLSNAPYDMTGVLQMSRPIGSSSLHVDLGYGLGHESLLQAMQVFLDRGISSGYRMRYGLGYDPARADPVEPTTAIYRRVGALDFGLNAVADLRGALKMSLLLSTSFSGGRSLRELAVSSPGATSSGNVSVRVFLDHNLNGKYGTGDTWLSHVGLKVNGRPVNVKSARDGTCVLNSLPPGQEAVVSLNEDTLENPSWMAETPGVRVTPRAGHVIHLEFGVIESAEIAGKAEGAAGQADGLTAEILDSVGKVVQTSVVDEDEAYVFSQVRPGDYTLMLVRDDGTVYGSRAIKVPPGALIKDLDIKVTAPVIGQHSTNLLPGHADAGPHAQDASLDEAEAKMDMCGI